MRRLLALMLSVLLLFSLVACGGEPQQSDVTSTPSASETQIPSASEPSGYIDTTTLPIVQTDPIASQPTVTDPFLTTTGLASDPTAPTTLPIAPVTTTTQTDAPATTTTTPAKPVVSTTKPTTGGVVLTQKPQQPTAPSAAVPTTAPSATFAPSTNGSTTLTDAIVTTTTTATVTTQPAIQQKPILCWGDSLTDGMGMANYSGNKYPDALQNLLGDEFKVYNGGYSGDKSIAIMSRQGAYTLKTKNAITFKAGEATVKLGLRANGFGFVTDDGTELTGMNVQIGSGATQRSLNYLLLNPTVIGGLNYKLGITFDGVAKVEDGAYYVTLTREDASAAYTIPAGTPVVLGNSDMSANSYCEIILMGANDGLGTSEEDTKLLISRYQKMINHMGHDRYLVIIPYWGNGAHTALFKQAFGNKAISLFDEITEDTMKSVGVTPSASDLSMLEKKVMPLCLQYSKTAPDHLHLNEYGYKLIAKFVHERGKTLGYW